jgi:hypothetical protein
MAETHVVSALINKRAELAGQITSFEQRLGQFRADLTQPGNEAIRRRAQDVVHTPVAKVGLIPCYMFASLLQPSLQGIWGEQMRG